VVSNEDTLARFLDGQLDLAPAINDFARNVVWHQESSHHIVATGRANPSLVVTPEHLIPMLAAFLEGRRSEQQVSTWATLILALNSFVVPEHPERGTPPEAVRTVLESLATPPAENSVTPSAVRAHLVTLTRASAS
jgi:hypothetical protein